MAKKSKKKPALKKSKKGGGSWNISFFILFFVLLLDQGSKALVHAYIPQVSHEAQWYPYHGIGVFEDFGGIEFSIIHAINRGAAWSLFSDFFNYLVVFRIIFIAILIVYLTRYNNNRKLLIPFSLIIAGAVGNVIDSFVYGHVIDMFHFIFWGHHYPVFNIADSAICLGVGLVLLQSFFDRRSVSSFSS